MLYFEPDALYITYPSWAEKTHLYSWSSIKKLLVPLSIGSNTEKTAESTSFTEGAFGGGIIIRENGHFWPEGMVLHGSSSQIWVPDQMLDPKSNFCTPVSCLMPLPGIANLPVTGKSGKIYKCPIRFENCHNIEDGIIWQFNASAASVERIKTLVLQSIEVFRDFISDCSVVSQETLVNTDEYVKQSNIKNELMFQLYIRSQDMRAGIHYSMLMYTAFHIAGIGKGLKSAKLIAEFQDAA